MPDKFCALCGRALENGGWTRLAASGQTAAYWLTVCKDDRLCQPDKARLEKLFRRRK